MKAKNNFLSAPFALKLVGFILVFSSLLDYLFLVNGLGDFKDKQALGTGITQLVDRGVIPMIGVALILTAYWLERLADMPARNSKLFRFVALAISALLGVCFLILAPVHLSNTSKVADLARTQIKEQADKAEGQVEQQVQQRQAELTNLVKDTKQFDEQLKQMGEAIANSGNNQMPPEQLAQLKQLEKDLKEIKANPTALQNKAKESREQLLNRIRDEKQKAEQQVNSQAWKASAKTGLNSLILSVGYLIISWVGLSEMGLFSGDAKTRRAPNNNP
jgi:ABC-type multidrug transport system fused ATPase/permease subunit